MAPTEESNNATTATSAKGEINGMYGKRGSDDKGTEGNNDPFSVINRLKLRESVPDDYSLYAINALAPDILDMMIWSAVNVRRDDIIIRAYLRGYPKSGIARSMGIARTTVYRIIGNYLSSHNPDSATGQASISGDSIYECDIASSYPDQSSEKEPEKEQE